MFRPHKSKKPAFSNSSGLKSVFENLRIRGGLVWAVGLTVEIKLRFEILNLSGEVWTLPRSPRKNVTTDKKNIQKHVFFSLRDSLCD